MHDDWRLHVTLEGAARAESLAERLEAAQLSGEVASALGDAVAVSHDGAELFLYAGTRAAIETAEQLVRTDLDEHGWRAQIVASRWHDDAEAWEPADAPAAVTASEREAEHARLMRREDAESAADGPDFEVRAALPSHRAARELSERLTAEGVPHVQRWRYVFAGAPDEDAAERLAARVRAEAPPGTDVAAEGTFAYVERMMPTPFKPIAALGGGLP